jgi:methane monooxygenase PmoA-like
MDFTFTLAPVVDYVLHKQSFSGFNFQARKDGESYFTNSAGTVQLPNPHYSVPELNWPPAPWYGYVVKMPNGKVVGAAVIDHPSNPPSTWHNARNLWMVNPVIAALGPVTIRSGSPLTLRYRVVVHDGPTPTAVVEKLAAEFRGTK